jgi:hypothetical protein
MQPGPVTVETRVHPQASPCAVCGGQSGHDIRFIQVVQFSSRQHHFINAAHSFIRLSPMLYDSSN